MDLHFLIKSKWSKREIKIGIKMLKSFYNKLAKRGGVLRWRTLELGKGKYAHVAVLRKKGKLGGKTLIGEIRIKKRSR